MAKPKKEKGTRQPELHEIIEALDKYKDNLHKSKTVGPMKFMQMQSALFGAKQIVRDLYGAPRKGETAWIK
jgi:hypothetical protein